MPLELLGAVLAGGRSRRLGRDKALLRVDGESLLERAVATVRTVADDVVVVSRTVEDYAPGCPVVADLVPGRGPLGGIHTALVTAGGRGVVVLACDLPFAGPEVLAYVVEKAGASRGAQAEAAAWVPEIDGRRQPLCAVYSPACLATAESCLASDRLAVHELLSRVRTTAVPLTAGLAFFRPDLFLNLNLPADIEAAGVEGVSG